MSSEATSVSLPQNLDKCSVVLLDVAGTTTSMNFVNDTLLEYFKANVEQFIKDKHGEADVKECIKEMLGSGEELDPVKIVEKVKTLTESEDKDKNISLKSLQGFVYKDGYEKEAIKGHIFEDVSEFLESNAKSRRICIYSSGSVESQKLLFAKSIKGDVSGHINKYFDQAVGVKTESDSYKAIAKELEVTCEEIVFITDDLKEAVAAKTAGVTIVLIKREGNADLKDEECKEFAVISSLKDLGLDKKRKIEEEVAAQEAPPAKVAKTEEEIKKAEEPTTESMEVDETKTEETEKVTPAETETVKESEKTETPVVDEKMEEEVVEKTEEPVKVESEKEKESEIDEKKTEEKKEGEEAKVAEAEKVESTEEKKDEEKPKEDENIDKKDEEGKIEEEKKEESAPEEKVEEKENKSVLANGVENGKEEKTENGEATKDEPEKVEETEVVAKKLEETTETPTVSVEV